MPNHEGGVLQGVRRRGPSPSPHLLTLTCVVRGISMYWRALIRSRVCLFTLHQASYTLF